MTHTLQRLLDTYARPVPRYTSYPTAPHFHADFTPADYQARLRQADAQRPDAPWSLYLHLPFCQQRCSFCACNVIVSPQRAPVLDYLDHIKREADLVAAHIPNRRTVRQLHLGGGTPTYFTPDELTGLLDHLLTHFTLTPDAEVGIEVDPRVTTVAHLEALAALGFNRLSLGVQDLDPDVQRAIGRTQLPAHTEDLIRAGRRLGMTSINVDLVYGLPHQTPSSFHKTLHRVLQWAPDRLAVYSFAYLPWIAGHQRAIDPDTLPDTPQRRALWATARSVLTDAGYLDIGMDHFALPDDALVVAQRQGHLGRNFMGYTTALAPDMIGLGISSIGYVGGAYVQNTRKLSAYRAALAQDQLPVLRGLALTDDDLLRADAIAALMCNLTLDRRALAARFGLDDFDRALPDVASRLEPLIRDGLLIDDGHTLRVTPTGKLFVRNIASAFDAYLNDADAAPRAPTSSSRRAAERAAKPRFSQAV